MSIRNWALHKCYHGNYSSWKTAAEYCWVNPHKEETSKLWAGEHLVIGWLMIYAHKASSARAAHCTAWRAAGTTALCSSRAAAWASATQQAEAVPEAPPLWPWRNPRANFPSIINTLASRAVFVLCEVTDSPKGWVTPGTRWQNWSTSYLLLRCDNPHTLPSDCGI